MLCWEKSSIFCVQGIDIGSNGGTKACSNAKLRNDLVEEMADVLMYYNDVMLCYGISAEELKQSYLEKYKKNMGRW